MYELHYCKVTLKSVNYFSRVRVTNTHTTFAFMILVEWDGVQSFVPLKFMICLYQSMETYHLVNYPHTNLYSHPLHRVGTNSPFFWFSSLNQVTKDVVHTSCVGPIYTSTMGNDE